MINADDRCVLLLDDDDEVLMDCSRARFVHSFNEMVVDDTLLFVMLPLLLL